MFQIDIIFMLQAQQYKSGNKAKETSEGEFVMKKICTKEDIQRIPDFLAKYLEKRFHELMELYQGNADTFTLEPYGEMVLVEKYEEIRDLIFEEVNIKEMGGEKIFQCLYVPNNDKCIEFYVLESQLSLSERNQLIGENM